MSSMCVREYPVSRPLWSWPAITHILGEFNLLMKNRNDLLKTFSSFYWVDLSRIRIRFLESQSQIRKKKSQSCQ
jgi:hypothetical protein